jgi:hypothetical protein
MSEKGRKSPGSGRRRIEPTVAPIPPLNPTKAAIERFVAAVAAGLALGTIDPRTAAELKALAAVQLSSIRHRDTIGLARKKIGRDEAELAELREMVRKGEERWRQGQARAAGVSPPAPAAGQPDAGQ